MYSTLRIPADSKCFYYCDTSRLNKRNNFSLLCIIPSALFFLATLFIVSITLTESSDRLYSKQINNYVIITKKQPQPSFNSVTAKPQVPDSLANYSYVKKTFLSTNSTFSLPSSRFELTFSTRSKPKPKLISPSISQVVPVKNVSMPEKNNIKPAAVIASNFNRRNFNHPTKQHSPNKQYKQPATSTTSEQLNLQDEAEDRLFFPPYKFPFWGFPYGVKSTGGFFNPGLFPFVPGGPGFPPFDSVFGPLYGNGTGTFPGPGPTPFMGSINHTFNSYTANEDDENSYYYYTNSYAEDSGNEDRNSKLGAFEYDYDYEEGVEESDSSAEESEVTKVRSKRMPKYLNSGSRRPRHPPPYGGGCNCRKKMPKGPKCKCRPKKRPAMPPHPTDYDEDETEEPYNFHPPPSPSPSAPPDNFPKYMKRPRPMRRPPSKSRYRPYEDPYPPQIAEYEDRPPKYYRRRPSTTSTTTTTPSPHEYYYHGYGHGYDEEEETSEEYARPPQEYYRPYYPPPLHQPRHPYYYETTTERTTTTTQMPQRPYRMYPMPMSMHHNYYYPPTQAPTTTQTPKTASPPCYVYSGNILVPTSCPDLSQTTTTAATTLLPYFPAPTQNPIIIYAYPTTTEAPKTTPEYTTTAPPHTTTTLPPPATTTLTPPSYNPAQMGMEYPYSGRPAPAHAMYKSSKAMNTYENPQPSALGSSPYLLLPLQSADHSQVDYEYSQQQYSRPEPQYEPQHYPSFFPKQQPMGYSTVTSPNEYIVQSQYQIPENNYYNNGYGYANSYQQPRHLPPLEPNPDLYSVNYNGPGSAMRSHGLYSQSQPQGYSNNYQGYKQAGALNLKSNGRNPYSQQYAQPPLPVPELPKPTPTYHVQFGEQQPNEPYPYQNYNNSFAQTYQYPYIHYGYNEAEDPMQTSPSSPIPSPPIDKASTHSSSMARRSVDNLKGGGSATHYNGGTHLSGPMHIYLGSNAQIYLANAMHVMAKNGSVEQGAAAVSSNGGPMAMGSTGMSAATSDPPSVSGTMTSSPESTPIATVSAFSTASNSTNTSANSSGSRTHRSPDETLKQTQWQHQPPNYKENAGSFPMIELGSSSSEGNTNPKQHRHWPREEFGTQQAHQHVQFDQSRLITENEHQFQESRSASTQQWTNNPVFSSSKQYTRNAHQYSLLIE